MKYFTEIHNLKNRIKKMQKLYNENKTETAAKDTIKNLICLNHNSLIILMNILKLINNSKFIINFTDSFNHICENIIIIY